MKEIIEKLSAPFADHELEWRVGSTNKKSQEKATGNQNAKATKGIMLPYVTNRAIMNRLDEVVGAENWKDTYRDIHKGIICALSIRFSKDGDWLTKEDGADLTNIEPTKGGLSDSMKRAAVKFGIGRYLYEAETAWVDLDEWGRPGVAPVLKLKSKPAPEMTIEDACARLLTATTLDELKTVYTSLSRSLQADNEVIAKKDELKTTLTV